MRHKACHLVQLGFVYLHDRDALLDRLGNQHDNGAFPLAAMHQQLVHGASGAKQLPHGTAPDDQSGGRIVVLAVGFRLVGCGGFRRFLRLDRGIARRNSVILLLPVLARLPIPAGVALCGIGFPVCVIPVPAVRLFVFACFIAVIRLSVLVRFAAVVRLFIRAVPVAAEGLAVRAAGVPVCTAEVPVSGVLLHAAACTCGAPLAPVTVVICHLYISYPVRQCVSAGYPAPRAFIISYFFPFVQGFPGIYRGDSGYFCGLSCGTRQGRSNPPQKTEPAPSADSGQ